MNTEILLPLPELKLALSGLNKLVGRKSLLPVLSHVRITRQDGRVQLQGTDIDAFATFTLNDTQLGEGVDVLVPLDQLNKAYKSSGAKDPVALVLDDDSTKLRYSIGGSTVNQSINILPAKEWPVPPTITVPECHLPPEFGQALKQALECVSDDVSRHVLRGACLDARDSSAHYVVGTDGRILFSANSFSFPMNEAVIIPNSKFLNGAGFLDNDSCYITVQPGKKRDDIKHISLRNRQWQYVTREIEGQFPDWKVVVPKVDEKWTRVSLPESAINQLLKVIPNLPGADLPDSTIRLQIERNCLRVGGRNKEDRDWTEVEFNDVTVTGGSNEICLNRHYLLPALKFGLYELGIQDNLSAMVCSCTGKKMVIMPLRPAQQTKAEPAKHKPAKADQTTSAPQPSIETKPDLKPVEERKTEMTAKTAAATTTTTAATPTPVLAAKTPEAPTSLLDQIESVKESAKNLVRDLTSLTEGVRMVDKDRRANEKELENVRSVLKKLQQVTL